MQRRYLLAVAVLSLLSMGIPGAYAGKYNPTLNIGDAAPDWRDLPGTDERSHSLADFARYDVLVIVFTCNTCPTAVDYEERIKTLAAQHAADGKCGVVAINANQVAGDQLPKMRERAAAQKFNFPYLRDESQAVAKAYGATVTPEFFVLNKERRVVYMGAFDDSTDAQGVKVGHVADAVGATLAGRSPEVKETVGRGCLVRYARERRKK